MGFSYDLDEFPLDYVRYYRTIVVRRSPTASRPPSNYRLTFSGRYYDVFQREADSEDSVIAHAALGPMFERGDIPKCRDVRTFARRAREMNARLAYSPAPDTSSILPTQTTIPPGWFIDPTEGHVLRPRGPGTIHDTTRIDQPGSYDVWVMGSFGRGYDVLVDGRRIGEVSHHLNGRGQYDHAGRVELDRGRHSVTLNRGGGSLAAGDGLLELLGPVLLTRHMAEPYAARVVDPAEAESLCGRRLDWFEIVS